MMDEDCIMNIVEGNGDMADGIFDVFKRRKCKYSLTDIQKSPTAHFDEVYRPLETADKQRNDVILGYGLKSLPELKRLNNVTSPDIEKSDDISRLIQTTLPDVKWRTGVFYILRECKNETDLKRKLTFLRQNTSAAINVFTGGHGTSVAIEENSAPKSLLICDWLTIIDGLGLETTSPGTTRNIDYVDVTIGQHTDVDCLNGFKRIVESLLRISWTNMQLLIRIDIEQGVFLFNTLTSLEAGNEIDVACRRSLNDLWSRLRFLLKSLGFARLNERSPLQWERPELSFREEFDSLCIVFRGLFRPIKDFPVLESGCHL